MNSKIAIITGASRGLGKSMALHLARRGAGVVGTYREKRAQAEEVIREIEALGGKGLMLQLDTSKVANLQAFADALPAALETTFGRRNFDYLINSAGTGSHNIFTDVTEQEVDGLFAIHFKAPLFLSQLLLPLMVEGGRILNVSTGLTRMTIPGSVAYASAKGAVEILTRYMAQELGNRKISVNAIAPGAIETDFSGGMVRDNPEVNKMIASRTALGRVGLPDDIGAAVAALLSDETAWITGQRIEASGGQML